MKSLSIPVLLGLALQASAAVSIEQYHSHDFEFRATVAGNPFDVEMTAEFSGPGSLRLRVPAFYDGNGIWKVRFSPTRTGDWSMKTVSSLPELNAKTESSIQCTANRHPAIHGALRVDPAYPHHFIYEDGTRYFLLGYEADWLWGVGMSDPKRTVMNRLIDQMAQRGFNHVLVNVYAHDTAWAPGKSCEWDYGPPEMYAWEGTNADPDHSRLNPKFFQLYDGMMQALREKGIVAHIMIKVYNKNVKWPAPGSRDEEKFFRYVVARYQAFSNVVWDFSKESFNEKDEILQSRLIDFVRANDAYRRLTTVHDDDVYEWDPVLSRNIDFRTDQQHSNYAAITLFDRARRQYPIFNAEFGYEYGVEKLPTHKHVNQSDWQEHLRRAYVIYMAGGYGAYYYNNTAWDVVKPDPEPPGMARFQLLKDTLSRLPYWRMTPSDELAVSASRMNFGQGHVSCLASPGEVYACYVDGEGLTVNLTGLEKPANAAAEWVDTWSGERVSIRLGEKPVQQMRKPASFGKAPGLVTIRRAGLSTNP